MFIDWAATLCTSILALLLPREVYEPPEPPEIPILSSSTAAHPAAGMTFWVAIFFPAILSSRSMSLKLTLVICGVAHQLSAA